MLLFWSIRYLDRPTKSFANRDLWLDTASLDPVTRAKVHLCAERTQQPGRDHEWFQFKHLFTARSPDERESMLKGATDIRSICILGYFEDEHGERLSGDGIAQALSGDPGARGGMATEIPEESDASPFRNHPVNWNSVSLDARQLRQLAIFERDCRELAQSAFYREQPGTIERDQAGNSKLVTAYGDEELRSFLVVFRRLYMSKHEQADMAKASDLIVSALSGHAASMVTSHYRHDWVSLLEGPPFSPLLQMQPAAQLSTKSLIDAFLYTRYFHQPVPSAERKYKRWHDRVGGDSAYLKWLFVFSLRRLALPLISTGEIAGDLLLLHAAQFGVRTEALQSVADEHPALGTVETVAERDNRLLAEAVVQLADEMMMADGAGESSRHEYLGKAAAVLRQPVD